MKNSQTMFSRVFTVFTVVALVFALNVSGALAGFWRSVGSPNPTQFLFGYGEDENGDTGYGYGYGYGYGDFDAGYMVTPDTTPSTGGSSGGSIPTVEESEYVNGWSSSSSSNNKDNCPDGDLSGSRYDNTCLAVNSEYNETEEETNEKTPEVVTPTEENESACVFPNITVEYGDVDGNWAEAYIANLSSKGIMNGRTSTLMDPDGMFMPNSGTTRIEMLKIALRTFCYEYKDLSGNENFGDIIGGSWQARVVELASALGVIAQNDNFYPNEVVSRAEALKMLLNVGATRTTALNVDSSVTTTSYTDVTVTWQAKYFEAAKNLGIISAATTVRPAEGITRSETAKISFQSQSFWNGWTQQ